MRTRKKLLPGQPGTRKLLRKYDEDLVCVRYREDAQTKCKLKTVEIIVERAPWSPEDGSCVAGIPIERTVGVKIGLGEVELQKKARAAGGKWNRERQLWELPYGKALNLGWAVFMSCGHLRYSLTFT